MDREWNDSQPIYRQLRDRVVAMIRGEKGTTVRLRVIPSDALDPAVRSVIAIVRDEIKLTDQEAKARVYTVPALKKGERSSKIGVLDLPSFYADMQGGENAKSLTKDTARLLAELKRRQVDGIVVDLRRDGGESQRQGGIGSGGRGRGQAHFAVVELNAVFDGFGERRRRRTPSAPTITVTPRGVGGSRDHSGCLGDGLHQFVRVTGARQDGHLVLFLQQQAIEFARGQAVQRHPSIQEHVTGAVHFVKVRNSFDVGKRPTHRTQDVEIAQPAVSLFEIRLQQVRQVAMHFVANHHLTLEFG